MRKDCRACGSENLIDILSLGEQFLSDFREDDLLPEKYPLDLILCQGCHLLQLKHTTPPHLMYNERYGFKSGINNTIRADLAEIVQNAIDTVKLQPDEAILDIGANDGTLLSNYNDDVLRVAVEPVQKLAKQAKNHSDILINDFFSFEALQKQIRNRKFKIITSISMFYDLEDPNKFISDITKILDSDGVWVIQQNYLVGMLTQNAFDNICHEHLEYYSLLSLENVLKRHGLEVFHVELNDINGGSFRTYVRFCRNQPTNLSVLALRQGEKMLHLDNRKPYLDFAERVRKNSEILHKVLDDFNDSGDVYAYGASTRGNTLMQYANLNNRLVKAAIERNPEKVGKKIASLQIPIISEEQAREEKPSAMLVLPWFFKKEFIEREKDYLLGGGKFIIPLPDVEIIGEEVFRCLQTL